MADAMQTVLPNPEIDALRERVRDDFPFWAEKFAKIVNKDAELVPFLLKDGQLELDEALEAQRKAGRPRRAIILKSRQVGFSTYTQGKLIHECTLRERVEAMVVAQDGKTGEKLYRMGERIYANLPDDPELKPTLGRHRRSKFLHFTGEGSWQQAANAFPDSSYSVDTAGEYEAGRGVTPNRMHLSEIAFWPQILQKLTALLQGVPDTPDSLVIYESTANGYNAFKDLWDDAAAGRSQFIAFFWPWWREKEYKLDFLNDVERGLFEVGDEDSPYAEREPQLVKEHDLSLEQLNWRRWVIANKCGGDLRKFDQEYPTVPEDAFISTGQKVFEPYRVQEMTRRVEAADPPLVGDFEPKALAPQVDRAGNTIQVPTEALWVPRQRGIHTQTHPFKLWLSDEELEKRTREYLIGVDVSGGNTESTGGKESDYHAIQVIDHETREQVGEYHSRIEPSQLVPIILLAALYFNNAYVAIERTGGWGGEALRTLYRDFHYPFLYRPKRPNIAEKLENRLGWDTTQRTKPEMVAGLAGLLLEGGDGIKSKDLANEVRTYTRTENGSTEAEPGRFDDLLMAYMIVQQVARERPLMNASDGAGERAFVAAAQNPLSAYDPRLR